jgi:hypothetical protein
LAPETKIKFTPETKPFHVPTCTIMYLVLSVGLLFLADWLMSSVFRSTAIDKHPSFIQKHYLMLNLSINAFKQLLRNLI